MNNKKLDLKTSSYGFIKASDVPDLDYKSNKLKYDKITWAEMSSFNDIAKNHCGATLITNLCIFYDSQGYEGLLIDGSIRKTFEHIHGIIGNGPVIATARTAKRYFSKKGYDLIYKSIYNFNQIKDAIDKNMPVAMLLAEKIFEWHWVLGVGYLKSDKVEFVRIINAWEDTDQRFYLINHKSNFFSAVRYDIKRK